LKRILVVGVGSVGQRHIRAFLATGRAQVAVCDTDLRLLCQTAAQWGLRRGYESLDEAMGEEFDAAIVATPAQLHVRMATRLAEAGIHVLIEKPLGTSMAGVEELQQAVARHSLAAAVGYVYRLHPALAAMRQAIQSGQFGAPLQIVAVCGQHFPYYRPAYREIYYANRATGGGAIQDALTHVLNAGEWLAGPIDRLVADAAHLVLEGVDVEDTVHVMARHGAVLGSYSLNQHQAPDEVTITAICERGTARFEFHNHRWRWMTHPAQPWHDERHEPPSADALFIAQANAFLDAIEGGEPLCSLAEGVQTLRANLAAMTSVEQASWQCIEHAADVALISFA
jgi:predicted dehydrogenase